MAAQRGKDLLIKLDAEATGDFVTVAGLRATRFALNAAQVDATTAESAGRWRELLTGGRGVFKDAASDAALRTVFFAGAAPAFQLAIPYFGQIEGAFQVAGLEYAGDHDGEAVFEISLESAGPLSFTAV